MSEDPKRIHVNVTGVRQQVLIHDAGDGEHAIGVAGVGGQHRKDVLMVGVIYTTQSRQDGIELLLLFHLVLLLQLLSLPLQDAVQLFSSQFVAQFVPFRLHQQINIGVRAEKQLKRKINEKQQMSSVAYVITAYILVQKQTFIFRMDSESNQEIAFRELEDNELEYQQQCGDYYELSVPVLNSQSSEYSEPPILSYSYSGISNASSTPEFTLHSSRMSEQPVPNFVFIKAEKLFCSLQRVVKDVREVLALEDDIVLFLLYKHQWSKQKVYQNYQSDNASFSQINLKLQYHKQPAELIVGECNVCYVKTQLMPNVLCEHQYCRQCWKDYINEKLTNNKIFFPCMHKCEMSAVVLHRFVEKMLPELAELYRKIICINYAATNKAISYCPAYKKECDMFCQRTQSNCDIMVECQCGEFYCFFCRKEPHFPATCEDVNKWAKLLNDDESNNKWIQKNTKACPSCKNPVEKYIGCSKVKCVCGAQFCYECSAKWDQNHKSSKGECMNSLSRKSSLEERATTTDFMKLQQRSMAIGRTLKKNLANLNTALECIKEEWIAAKFNGIRKQITEDWLCLKWSSIVSFIYKRSDVSTSIQADFIECIQKLMESVQKMNTIAVMLSTKDMIGIGDEVLSRRQALKKVKDLWFQGWRSTN